MNNTLKNKSIGIMVLIAMLFLGVGVMIGSNSSSDKSSNISYNSHQGHGHDISSEAPHKREVWTCSMHPQIKVPKSGKCPICAMDLIPLEKNSSSYIEGPTITLSPYAKKLAKVMTAKVLNGGVNGSKEFLGIIAWNESLLKTEPAWFSGRIEKLRINHTGQYVRKGQVIAEIYSPELYSAAEEWKQAKQSKNQNLTEAVKKKLALLGLDEEGIKHLGEVNSERVLQRAKNSGVVVQRNVEEGQYIKTGSPMLKLGSTSNLWVELEVYEQDIALIKKGQKVMVKTESLVGKEFQAKVQFVDHFLNPKTRTVRIRLSIKNQNNLLKPGMLVRGYVNLKGDDNGLYIPETAPLFTGKRSLVYVEESEGVYASRTVELGELRNGYYEVIHGLTGDELVVNRGAFKIDAAMQIQANPSMMYPKGGGSAGAHNHGEDDNAKPKIITKRKDHSKHSVNKPAKKRTVVLTDEKWVLEIYESYLKLQETLSNDDVKGASKALELFANKLHTTPKALDDGHIHHRAAGYEKTASSGNIASIRTDMIDISKLMIKWIRGANTKPKQGAAVYFCPMANNNSGAEWLQTGGSVKNPYYGSSMLSCGEQRKILSKGLVK